jgi:hypothetical protein
MLFIGVLGVRLVNGNNEDAHIIDAVALIASAISHLFEEQANISGAPNACDETARWDSGSKIFRYSLCLFIFFHDLSIIFGELLVFYYYLLTMAGGGKPRLRQDIQDNIQLQDRS